jgi:Protein of unknown function (DUF3147)
VAVDHRHTAARDVTPSLHPEALGQISSRELIVRFCLGAAVSVIAGIIAQAVGARFGGLFLAFPAILPASLTIVQEKEGTRRADRDAIGAVLGACALVVFAVVAESTFTRLNPVVVLTTSLAGWIVACAILYGLLAVVRPDDCDKRMD